MGASPFPNWPPTLPPKRTVLTRRVTTATIHSGRLRCCDITFSSSRAPVRPVLAGVRRLTAVVESCHPKRADRPTRSRDVRGNLPQIAGAHRGRRKAAEAGVMLAACWLRLPSRAAWTARWRGRRPMPRGEQRRPCRGDQRQITTPEHHASRRHHTRSHHASVWPSARRVPVEMGPMQKTNYLPRFGSPILPTEFTKSPIFRSVKFSPKESHKIWRLSV